MLPRKWIFCGNCFFITDDELNTLNPPIEEFAFSLSSSNIKLGSPMGVGLIVEYPNRIAQSNEARFVDVVFTRDNEGNLILSFMADYLALWPTTKSYRKVF